MRMFPTPASTPCPSPYRLLSLTGPRPFLHRSSGALGALGGHLIGELFAQLAFEDLAGGVARQVLHEEDVLGALKVRQLLPGVLFQLLAQDLPRSAFPAND